MFDCPEQVFLLPASGFPPLAFSPCLAADLFNEVLCSLFWLLFHVIIGLIVNDGNTLLF